ncbi:MAG: hypothetical protein ACLTTU_11330 [Bilophila wadsworthia]
MSHSSIHIEGARQHNLKNLSLDIPRDELVVVCGPSGSGKSTLAFDIVYAEGQRRYVESLSAYARQFLPQMDKPDVDKIEGLSPAISLEQQTTGRNPRSTVGTVTEVYDFLRVFFARLGKMYCPQCGRPIEARAADEIIADILALPEGTKVIIMAPLVELQKGTHLDRFKKLKAEGFVRVRVDGQLYGMEDIPALDKNKKHTIDLVIDRLVIKDGIRGRLADSVELALRYGEGRIIVNEPDKGADGDTLHATESVCPVCKISLPAPSPQLFSFNSPQGACPRCAGLGTVEYFEPMLIAPNRGLSLNTKAILPWANPKTFARYEEALTALGKRFGFTLSTPLSAYSPEALQALFYGEDDPSQKSKSGLRRNRLGGSVALESPEYDDNAPAPVKAYDGPYKLATDNWPGVIPLLERGMQYGDMWRDLLSRYLQSMDCPTCHGARLRPESLAVRVDDLNIHQFCSLPVERALRWLNGREFDGRHALVAEPLLKELNHRLSFDQCGPDKHPVGQPRPRLRRGIGASASLQLGSGWWRNYVLTSRPSACIPGTTNASLPRPQPQRQHGAGGRARRSHHPRGRPHHRAWARFRRARRRHGVPRLFREPDQALGDADRQVHAGGSVRTHPRRTPRTQGLAHPARGHDQQPQGYRLSHSARHADLRDRGFRLGQKLTRGGHAVQAPRAGAGHPRGSARQHPGHRRRGGHRAHRGHRSDAHRTHAAVQPAPNRISTRSAHFAMTWTPGAATSRAVQPTLGDAASAAATVRSGGNALLPDVRHLRRVRGKR